MPQPCGEINKGTWKLSQHIDGKKKSLGQIEEMNNCDGDILFDYMTENEFIENWDEYETEGDNEYVAVMHKTGLEPDFCWEFSPEIEQDSVEPEEPMEAYQPPIKVYCDTCKSWTDESKHKFLDISEGMLGEDRMTFECSKCKQVSTSSRVG